MDKLKQWVALTVLAVLAIGAGSWFLLISPKKADASDLNTQADTTAAASQTLRNDIKVLQAQAKALPAERSKLAAVAAKLPADPGMPALIRALTNAADAAGVKFVSLTPGAAVAAVKAPTSVPKPKADADGEAVAQPATPIASGLTTIPVQIGVFGGFYQTQAFVSELENLPRALRVTVLAMNPGADPGAAAGSVNTSATTDGQHLLTAITGEVFSAAPAALSTTTPLAGPAGGAK